MEGFEVPNEKCASVRVISFDSLTEISTPNRTTYLVILKVTPPTHVRL